MLPINIINVFIASCLVGILVYGSAMTIKYTQKNVYRHYLVGLFSFWAVLMVAMITKFYIDGMGSLSYNKSIAGLPLILMGIPCFISLVSYPIIVLNSNLLKFRGWLKVVSPMIIAVALYFIISYLAGSDPFIIYANYHELISNIATTTAILRLSLIAIFFIYIMILVFNIWRIVPLYNDYVYDNIADSDCNVDWVRDCVKFIIVVTMTFFVMLFTNSPYVNAVYLSSVLFLFSYMVDMSLFCKISEDIEVLKIGWSRKEGWHVIEDNISVVSNRIYTQTAIDKIGIRLDSWMEEKSPYTRVDFTTKDILDEFPDLTNSDLGELFKSRAETFQSYVRKFRIQRACEIIKNSDNSIYPKQLFNLVGFSHYSSFSRSFVATMGQTPTEYRQQVLGLKE